MSKTFNAEAAQLHRQLVSDKMKGNYFEHYKGGLYLVIGISVDEASGSAPMGWVVLGLGVVPDDRQIAPARPAPPPPTTVPSSGVPRQDNGLR